MSCEAHPGPTVHCTQVDCDAIFDSDEIDRPSEVPPTPWEKIPELLQVSRLLPELLQVRRFLGYYRLAAC